MDDGGIGLADMVLLAVVHGAVQHLGAMIVERLRGQPEMDHPLDEPLRAMALQIQEELPKIRKALEDSDEKPKTRARR